MSLIKKTKEKRSKRIIKLVFVNNNYFQIESSDSLFLEQVNSYFSLYKENYMFMPQYQAGLWDGKVYYYDKLRRLLPIGLIDEFKKYVLKLHKDKRIILDNKLKELLYNYNLKEIESEEFTLNLIPYSHQEQAIKKSLFHRRGVIKSPTASGKSYIIACTLNFLYEKQEIYNSLIIVPSIQLVEQFKKDLISYGIEEDTIGIIYGTIKDKQKEFIKPFVISTWQSLCTKTKRGISIDLKWKKYLKEFDAVVIDEVHVGASLDLEIKVILKQCTRTKYRLGYTGTLPDNQEKLYGILSFIGPKILDIQTKNLIDRGIVSNLKIHSIEISYKSKNSYRYLDWVKVKQKVFKERKRLKVIEKICSQSQKNTLILVSYVESEGKLLEKFLKKSFPEKKIYFIHGNVNVEERERIRELAEKVQNLVIIATYGTFKLGINIKNLHRIIFASPLKAKISTLQSIGRGLRILPNKKLIVFDIIDLVKFLKGHGKKRSEYWKKEKFNVKIHRIN